MKKKTFDPEKHVPDPRDTSFTVDLESLKKAEAERVKKGRAGQDEGPKEKKK